MKSVGWASVRCRCPSASWLLVIAQRCVRRSVCVLPWMRSPTGAVGSNARDLSLMNCGFQSGQVQPAQGRSGVD